MRNTGIKQVGIRLNGQEAYITVWAPFAERVTCMIEGADGELSLEKGEYGYWHARTSRLRAGDRYLLSIDENYFPDPASRSQPDGVHGSSEVADLQFYWEDHSYQPPYLKDYIIYELHVGTFTPTHDFDGVIQHLSYLKALGITAIEIMPVAQFPGERNWGYDGVYPFAVQNSYGGARGLQKLVNAAHKEGIAVILDVVYNHFGPEGNYISNFGPYFTERYQTPWGAAVNYDDALCHGIRDFVLENVLMWFRDFHIDALRIDAVHAIKDMGAPHILQEIRSETDQWMRVNGSRHYLIAECDLNDRRFLDPVEKNGMGMDAQWADEFHHALRVAAGERRKGYYSDFQGVSHLAKAYENAYVYDGIYSDFRKKFFGTNTDSLAAEQFIVFSQNHDHIGNRINGERSSALYEPEMLRLMALAVMCSPYVPLIFMGEEWATAKPFQYFVSHSDDDLIAAVCSGRKSEFKAMFGEGDVPDPQAAHTFEEAVLNWDEKDEEPYSGMLKYYKELIAFRKTNLKVAGRTDLKAEYNDKKEVILLHLAHRQGSLMCVMNFSSSPQELVTGDKQVWGKIWDTQAIKWGGQQPASEEFSGRLFIPPASGLVYRRSSSTHDILSNDNSSN
ncbi:MAG: malto-oligosyltrehalose trehalohydrolase [Cytophagaceae bacterium SCN 52-12]|nr:MAG: malto-oligosyltrehalose trehalohydrolase [Cytophagaceae bacterium SCN 52-12]